MKTSLTETALIFVKALASILALYVVVGSGVALYEAAVYYIGTFYTLAVSLVVFAALVTMRFILIDCKIVDEDDDK